MMKSMAVDHGILWRKPKWDPMLVDASNENDMTCGLLVLDFISPFQHFKMIASEPVCNSHWWYVHKLTHNLLARSWDWSIELQNVLQMEKDFIISHGMTPWGNCFKSLLSLRLPFISRWECRGARAKQ
jgi:hypothetical protein